LAAAYERSVGIRAVDTLSGNLQFPHWDPWQVNPKPLPHLAFGVFACDEGATTDELRVWVLCLDEAFVEVLRVDVVTGLGGGLLHDPKPNWQPLPQ